MLHSKIKTLSSFTHPHVVPNPCDFLSFVGHSIIYFIENCTFLNVFNYFTSHTMTLSFPKTELGPPEFQEEIKYIS